MDPHTAVASHVLHQARAQGEKRVPAVIVSTASPYKFCQDVLSALQGTEAVQELDAFQCAGQLEALTGQPVPPQVWRLRELPIRHTRSCAKEQMGETVLKAFDQKKIEKTS